MLRLTMLLALIVPACAAQDPAPQKPPGYDDPHKVGRSLKTYPEILKQFGSNREKVDGYTADLKYSGSKGDDPVEYSGFVVYARDKDSVECYVELGRPSSRGLEPMIRTYQNGTALTVVDEDAITYSEYAIDPAKPGTWRPWTFFAFAIGKELDEAYEITVEADGDPIPKAIQRTEAEQKTQDDQMEPEVARKCREEADRLNKLGADLPPRVRLSMKARHAKEGYMRATIVTLDKDLLVPVNVCSTNRDTSTLALEVENLQKTSDFDRELFKKVPALKQEKTAGGALKYKKVS